MRSKLRLIVIALCPTLLRAIPVPLPVFDSGAINHLIEQVNEAKRMVKELNSQIKALTGKSKIKKVPEEQLTSFLPPEWQDFIPKQEKSNIQLASNINKDQTAYLVKKFKLMKKQFDTEAERLHNIQQLAKEVNETQDIKAAQDLQNKIQAEEMAYQENIHQFQVTKSLLEVEEKIAEKSSDLEIKCGNAKYRHMKYPNMFSIPEECSHLNALQKYKRNYFETEHQGPVSTESKKGWKHLGYTSKKYESGRGGPGTINTQGASRDKGGMSYGLYQMSEKGTVQQYQKFTKYSALKGLKPGTAEFNRTWKAVAKRDPEGFAEEQHAFIKKNYYDRLSSRLKRKGMDFSSRGRGIQDMIWSTSVQYGNKKIIENALKGQNVNAMSDAQIISVVQDYKLAHHKEHFASSYKKGLKEQSIISRIKQEKLDLLRITNK